MIKTNGNFATEKNWETDLSEKQNTQLPRFLA